MKNTNCKNSKRSLEVQLGEKPTDLLYYQDEAITGQFHQAIPRALSKPLNWIKYQACTQKYDEKIHDYLTRFL